MVYEANVTFFMHHLYFASLPLERLGVLWFQISWLQIFLLLHSVSPDLQKGPLGDGLTNLSFCTSPTFNLREFRRFKICNFLLDRLQKTSQTFTHLTFRSTMFTDFDTFAVDFHRFLHNLAHAELLTCRASL